ncbi:hypothetical protein KFE98_21620 [bacterium SCSIO 12741]|nr:hypothetical protein KFE98_21620 [bacterium SCSIO 12741]
MKKITPILAILLISLTWAGCNRGEEGCLDPAAENFNPSASRYGPCEYAMDTGDIDPNMVIVKIHVEPKVKGQAFELEKVYQDSLNRDFKVSDFRFYVANVNLINSENKEHQVTKTELIDHNTFPPISPTQPTWDRTIEGFVMPGTYQELFMGFGVDPELNEAYNHMDYPSDHPLSIAYTNMGWPWKSKYIFATINGNIDSVGNGDLVEHFYIHSGYSDLYRTNRFDLKDPINFEPGKTYHLYFEQDVLRTFSGLDMATEEGKSHTQNAEKKKISIQFQENLTHSLKFSRYTED